MRRGKNWLQKYNKIKLKTRKTYTNTLLKTGQIAGSELSQIFFVVRNTFSGEFLVVLASAIPWKPEFINQNIQKLLKVYKRVILSILQDIVWSYKLSTVRQ